MLQRIRHSRLYLYAIVVFLVVLVAGQLVRASDFPPGSQQDPLVTQSYVEQRSEQLKFYFEQRLQELDSLIQQLSDSISGLQGGIGSTQPGDGAGAALEVVNVPAGKMLTGYAGT